MNTIIILFLIVATVFALATLAYVVVDVIIERRRKPQVVEEPVEEQVEEPAEIIPIVEIIPEPEEFPEIVDYIVAEEADAMISDDLAMQKATYEFGAGEGPQDIINIGVLNKIFEADSLITIDILKERGLVSKKAGRIKILADGILNKPLTIRAESYSIQAIKMIELTGGTVIILKA